MVFDKYRPVGGLAVRIPLAPSGESVLLSSRAIGSATIRRAHAIHPPGAVQIEYSLWTRDVAAEILSLCKELEDQLIDPQTGAILRTIEANRFVTEVSWINGTSEGRHPLSAARAGLGRDRCRA
jgi:hypothetical protein